MAEKDPGVTAAQRELRWAEQDLKIASQNLDHARTQLTLAQEQYDHAVITAVRARVALADFAHGR